jgi:pyruvate,water dikinase
MRTPYVFPLEQVGLNDISLVGGKCASLAEMTQHMSALGVAVPAGFAITRKSINVFVRQ